MENPEEVLARVLELLERHGKKVISRIDYQPGVHEENGVISYAMGRDHTCSTILPEMLIRLASSLLPDEGQDRSWEATAVAARVLEELDQDEDATQITLPFRGSLEASRKRILGTANHIISEMW